MPLTTIEPVPRRPTDAAILDDIRVALDWQVFYDLRVTVVNAEVTIEGTVSSWSERRNIAAIVGQGIGVRRVVNRMSVRAAPIAELALRMSIEQALARRAMREARRIGVTIAGTRVTVIGTVGSPAEHAAVLGALVGTVGVVSVEDQLRIAPVDRDR